MTALDALLRAEGRYAVDARDVPWRPLLAFVLVCGFVHGFVMGLSDLRLMQGVYSGLKVPLLLIVSTSIALPNFYAMNAALGLRDDLAAALRGVLAAQATLAVVLLALAPLVALAYASNDGYPFAVLANGLLFLVATIAGHVTLLRHYRPLVARNRMHRFARDLWLTLYVFVAIQCAWMLRPFIGWPEREPQFLRRERWDNAYVRVLDAFEQFLR